LTELLSWNGPTFHICCSILARASTKTFVSRVQKQRKKFFSRKIRYQGHSLAEVSLYKYTCYKGNTILPDSHKKVVYDSWLVKFPKCTFVCANCHEV